MYFIEPSDIASIISMTAADVYKNREHFKCSGQDEIALDYMISAKSDCYYIHIIIRDFMMWYTITKKPLHEYNGSDLVFNDDDECFKKRGRAINKYGFDDLLKPAIYELAKKIICESKSEGEHVKLYVPSLLPINIRGFKPTY